MDYSVIEGFSQKERELFRSSCNHLLGKTFVVRTIYKNGANIPNPEYTFLVRYKEIVKDYLSLLGWDIYQDEFNGYFYVLNDLEENRLSMNKITTGILLALRLIYDENSESAGLYRDVICSVRDLLDKIITDFSLLRQKPNMDEIRRSLKLLEEHSIIVPIEGRYNEMSCNFTILPTIFIAVSAEKLNALVEQMKKTD